MKRPNGAVRRILSFSGALFFTALQAFGQQAITIKDMSVEDRGTKKEFALGNTVVVTLDTGNVKKLRDAETSTKKVGLFLNELFMNGIDAQPDPNGPDILRFQLQYTSANKDVWSQLFGRKISGAADGDQIKVAIGLNDGSLISQPYSQPFDLEFLPNKKAMAILWVSIILVVVTIILGKWTSMLRDSGIPRFDKKLGSYSLGRTQMAFWFATIVFAFLFIYAVTGVVPPITQGALILMGIGAGTALGAASIDESKKPISNEDINKLIPQKLALEEKGTNLEKNKPEGDESRLAGWEDDKKAVQNQLNAVKDQLAPAQVAASDGFIKDLLSDDKGVSFHRLQVVGWMLVFWVLFLSSLFGKFTMMDFDTTQLALMGISGSTYLGFKLAEKQP